MAEHTYARDQVILLDQLAPFSDQQRHDVRSREVEAIGYARGRMDACQDHGLPWTGVDPLDFAASYARHVADAIQAQRTGSGSTGTRAIRDAWESYVVDGRVRSVS